MSLTLGRLFRMDYSIGARLRSNNRFESRPTGARTHLPGRRFAAAKRHPRKWAVQAGRYTAVGLCSI